MRADTGAAEQANVVRSAARRGAAAWILLPLFFLATGGSLRWWQAWAYCAVLLLPMTVFMVRVARRDPELLARRMKVKEKEREQKKVLAWGVPLLVASLVIPGLDHRFGWSAPPTWAVVLALGIVLSGYIGMVRVMIENRWAGRTIETYEGQQVISTGLYAIVRHPMYSGTVIFYVFTPLALGSYWAVIPASFIIPALVARIIGEEKELMANLEGYRQYTSKVRYRLIPGLW